MRASLTLPPPAQAISNRDRLRPLLAAWQAHVLVRNEPLRRVFVAGLVSALGDRLHLVALATLVLALTNSVALAGMTFVVSALPYVLFGLVAGALVDRWNGRVCLVGADLARAVLVALIPLAAVMSLPLLYALLFGMTCARMLFVPAHQALVPSLVVPADLVPANAAIRGAHQVADVVGLPLAGILVAALAERMGALRGAQVAFAVDALSFVISSMLLSKLPSGKYGASRVTPAGSLRQEVAAGLKFLIAHAGIRTNTLLLTLAPLLLGSINTLWVAFAWRVTETGATGYGVMTAFMGLGTLAGVTIIPAVSFRAGTARAIVLGIGLTGVALLCLGTTPHLGLAAACAFVSGVGNMLFLIPSVSYVQRQTPPELRGRVFGVRMMLTYAAVAASNALAGVLAEAVSPATAMLLMGGAGVALAVLAFVTPTARDAE